VNEEPHVPEVPGVPLGWNAPYPAHLPRPTAWPALFALGVTVFAWGIVTSPVLLLVGAALLFYSLGQWIGELRHEAH
jgi:hypothetical protein